MSGKLVTLHFETMVAIPVNRNLADNGKVTLQAFRALESFNCGSKRRKLYSE